MTRYRISQETGINQGTLSRFMSGPEDALFSSKMPEDALFSHVGTFGTFGASSSEVKAMKSDALDRLTELLDLEIVTHKRKRK